MNRPPGRRAPLPILSLLGLRIMTTRRWNAELRGLAELMLDMGKVVGRAEVYERLGLEMPDDEYALKEPLRLYPPTWPNGQSS